MLPVDRLEPLRALFRCAGCGRPPAEDLSCPRCRRVPRLDGDVLDLTGEEAPGPDAHPPIPPLIGPGAALAAEEELLERVRSVPLVAGLDAAVARNATVLDHGSGTGLVAAALACSSPARRVVAVDSCRESLGLLARLRAAEGLDNLLLVRAGAGPLPFATAAFDVVHSRGLVHRAQDSEQALVRVADHVRPGGVLVLGYYDALPLLPHHLWQRAGDLKRRAGRALLALPWKRAGELEPAGLDPEDRLPGGALALGTVARRLRDLGFEGAQLAPPGGDASVLPALFLGRTRPTWRIAAGRARALLNGLGREQAWVTTLVARRRACA